MEAQRFLLIFGFPEVRKSFSFAHCCVLSTAESLACGVNGCLLRGSVSFDRMG